MRAIEIAGRSTGDSAKAGPDQDKGRDESGHNESGRDESRPYTVMYDDDKSLKRDIHAEIHANPPPDGHPCPRPYSGRTESRPRLQQRYRDEIRQTLAKNMGVDATGMDFLPFTDLEQSVRDDIRAIRESRFIPTDVTVRGFVYDVTTGRVLPVEDG